MGKAIYDERFFRRTKQLVVGPSPESIIASKPSIIDLFGLVSEREKMNGKPAPIFSSSLWSGLESEKIEGFNENQICFIYELLYNKAKEFEIGRAADVVMKACVYSYLEGLLIIRQALLNGLLDDNLRNIVVSVRYPGTDFRYRLRALRGIYGKLSISLLEPFGFCWQEGTSVVVYQIYSV